MNISKQIVGYLKSRGLVLASIETCTAGAMTAALIDLPGAAACLDISVVAPVPRALAGWPGASSVIQADVGVSEPIARALVEGLIAQRSGHANVALASIGWLTSAEESSVPVAHCFAWAYENRGAVVSASETVLFSGRRAEVRRSVARRALLGVPRFVDSILARERADSSK
ncbi:CinA family protein [Paraburkholderia sp. J67]|uniref:CinA family protein n=1 Tax=Paraburkholderia sp. J67 TaxID=2805435 RepID=UPI002ABDF82F|nr:CinA family protein [Paraburkholderia sp. J67]